MTETRKGSLDIDLESNEDAKTHASPLTEEDIAPCSTDSMVGSKEVLNCNVQEKDNSYTLPPLFEKISCFLHLAVFGDLGVLTRQSLQLLTRHLLQKLFGPDFPREYLDLSSNIIGSFLMGWLGVVFKARISTVSDHLATGLTTGFLGSLATFSDWNQKMLDLAVDGKWLRAFFNLLLGLILPAFAIKFGVWTAKLYEQRLETQNCGHYSSGWRVNSFRRHLTVMIVLALMLSLLWTLSGIFLWKEFNSNDIRTKVAELLIALIVGPPGVWIRWFLALSLNGRGLGRSGVLNWLPFGTLIANISASCIMAALATVKNKMDTKNSEIIATGIQFGFLGCLSAVSTFVAEWNAMEGESTKRWRAYVYVSGTILLSFTLGILIYAIPVSSK